jgi:NAD(P)H-hydrate epimerase
VKIVTADEMREIERRAAGIGLPWEVLMENAGKAVAQEIRQIWGRVAGRRVLVLVGPGNNGGDGLVASRYLHDWGADVHAYLCSQRLEADPNYGLAQERGFQLTQVAQDESLVSLDRALSSADAVIDALFGTGTTRPIDGILREVLGRLRQAKEAQPKLITIAVDLPSGLNSDTGAADPACPSVDITITLGYPKLGLFALPGWERAGKLIVTDIGIPPDLGQELPTELITAEETTGLLPQRPPDANKGTFGRVLVTAGSINYIGAAYLACAGATRVGAGLVTLATAQSLQPTLAARLTEVTYAPLPESEPGLIAAEATGVLQERLPDYNALLLGCGLGQSPSVIEFITSSLLPQPASLPALVLDADALNTLANIPQWWHRLPQDAILSPHPGEMARLTGLSVSEVQSDRLGVTRQAAARWGKTVVLKGAFSLVAAPDGRARISPVANPGLASAGTGDVLAGAIVGLVAQGLRLFDAAACGVYLHAAAAEIVKENLGDAGMLASDLLPALPLAIKRLKESNFAL